MPDRTTARMLLASLTFSAWFTAVLFGVLVPAAHLFLAAAIWLWPWRATLAAARDGRDSHVGSASERDAEPRDVDET